MNFSTQTSLQFEHLTKIFSFFFYKNTDFRVPGPTWQRHQIEKVVDQGQNIITNHIYILFEKKTKKQISLHLEEESIHISVDMLVEIQPSRAGWSLYRGCLATRHGHARGDRAVYWLAVIRHFLKGTIPCFQAFSFHRSDVARYDPVQSDNLLFLKE